MKYHVQNPWTDNTKGKTYPLIEVEIEELLAPVITKTGLRGTAMTARVSYTSNGKPKTVVGTAVHAPSEGHDFSYFEGAKLALQRAMDQTKMTKKTRKSIWDGFFMFYKA